MKLLVLLTLLLTSCGRHRDCDDPACACETLCDCSHRCACKCNATPQP